MLDALKYMIYNVLEQLAWTDRRRTHSYRHECSNWGHCNGKEQSKKCKLLYKF